MLIKVLFPAFPFIVQWGFFEKQLGRKDADGPDPAGRVPVWSELSGTEIKEAFVKLGLRPAQVTECFLGGPFESCADDLEKSEQDKTPLLIISRLLG